MAEAKIEIVVKDNTVNMVKWKRMKRKTETES